VRQQQDPRVVGLRHDDSYPPNFARFSPSGT